MIAAPKRIRLSRSKGWRLPPNTVNVARPGPLGNPFVVGIDGTRAECVKLCALLCAGIFCLTCKAEIEAQRRFRTELDRRIDELRGQDIGCWCALDGLPCHGDVILALANEPQRPGMLDRFVSGARA
jgi:hypothetical protein